MPWSVFRGERAPGERWTTRDAMLAVALTQLEASLCSGCGQPSWLAYDPDVWWEVDDAPLRCMPCTHREAVADAWMAGGRDDEGNSTVKAPSALRWTVQQVPAATSDD